MKQLFQDPKAGTISLADVPEPATRRGFLRVRNAYSIISPGTERNVVATARDSYLKTARTRPDLVRRVVDSVKKEGLLATYRKVQTKLSEPQALGYSCAGIVEEVGPGSGDHFRVGDRVACAGAGYASHAEVVSVPVQLAARVPDGVDLESAAFTTLGAIALHGVRQGEPTLGERFGVIGLGILGLITVQLLRAAGVRVAAFDLDPDLVEAARRLGADVGVAGGTEDQVQTALAWTDGVGLDGIIVTAGSSSDAPMVAAGGMSRDKGRVVAVGLVPFGLPREIAFAKEIDLRVSRSYGPGRYDPDFEERGVDYPIGYVRWTETRNLEAFLALLADGRVDLDPLITHRYDFVRAVEGYDTLMESAGPRPLGMVIRYAEPEADTRSAVSAPPAPRPLGDGEIGVAFLGAGAFARSVLLPKISGRATVRMRRVATSRGLTAFDAQRKFGFEAVGTDVDEAITDPAVNLVFITTRHDSHADLVVRALQADRHVFVEKPVAMNEAELRRIEDAAAASRGILMVGFNRRFAPMVREVRAAMASRGPAWMTYRVNAGALPAGHWINDPQEGGGRMIGEGCHFLDTMSFLAGDAVLESVQSVEPAGAGAVREDFAIQVGFADGSVGQLLYTARGDASLPKERIEIHAGGASAVIDDFNAGTLYSGGRRTRLRDGGKGHAQEIDALFDTIRRGGPSPTPIAVAAAVTRATFQAHSIQAGDDVD